LTPVSVSDGRLMVAHARIPLATKLHKKFIPVRYREYVPNLVKIGP